MISYADDTVLISTEDTCIAAQNKMDRYLNIIAKFVIEKFSLNIGKVAFISCFDSLSPQVHMKINDRNVYSV